MKNIYPQGIQISTKKITNIYQQGEIFLPKRLQVISDKVTNIYQKDFKYIPTRWNISIYKNDLAKLMLINLRRGFDTFFGMLQQSTHYRSQQFHSYCTQTSYLSQISQVIFVEKNLSGGEISDFCKEFEQFVEYYQNLCRFYSKFVWRKSVWRKNDKYEVCLSTVS